MTTQAQVPSNPRERHIWIGASLRLKGSSFADIARQLGCTPQYVQKATRENSRRPQEAIAAKLGIPAHELFPEWYRPDGSRFGNTVCCDYNSGANPSCNVETGMRA